MSQRTHLLLLALAVSVSTSILATMGDNPSPLRILIGVPLVFLVPGHALTMVVDPQGRLGRVEWLTTAVASSLSLTALLGLVLAQSPWGLTPRVWTIALCLVTLILILAAATRHGASGHSSGHDLSAPPSHTSDVALLVVVAVLGCLAVVFVALTSTTPPSRGAGNVLQLWALPERTNQGVQVGVANLTDSSSHYVLKVTQNGALLSEKPLNMPAKTTFVVDIASSAIATGSPIVADLADTNNVVLRRVSAWPSSIPGVAP